jgi:hypothetical protein
VRSNSTRKNGPGQGGQIPKAKSVNDWRAIAIVIGAVFLLHACSSEWFFTTEQVDATFPGTELAATFKESASTYHEELPKIREAVRHLGQSLGLPIP